MKFRLHHSKFVIRYTGHFDLVHARKKKLFDAKKPQGQRVKNR